MQDPFTSFALGYCNGSQLKLIIISNELSLLCLTSHISRFIIFIQILPQYQ